MQAPSGDVAVPVEPPKSVGVGWLVATVECRVCSHRHIAVYPEDIDEEDNQECSKCHAMAAEPIEYHGPDS